MGPFHIIIIGCPSISMKTFLSWISGVSFPPSFQVLFFSLSFNGVTSINDLFPPKRSIFGITPSHVYIHVSRLQMTLQNIFVTQLLPTTFPFSRRQLTVEAFGSLSSGILTTWPAHRSWLLTNMASTLSILAFCRTSPLQILSRHVRPMMLLRCRSWIEVNIFKYLRYSVYVSVEYRRHGRTN